MHPVVLGVTPNDLQSPRTQLGRKVRTPTDPVEQERTMKFNALLTNVVIFRDALDIAEIVRQLLEEGWEVDPEELARILVYLTEHISRFGEYSTHELGIQPEAFDLKLDVDFTSLCDRDLARCRPWPGRLSWARGAHGPAAVARPSLSAGCCGTRSRRLPTSRSGTQVQWPRPRPAAAE
ncbi:Tn3 family transposase [Streptomyces sp. NPDC057575]|uniref:Tn3 family transposase n=1 Tax=unclassified Streptomyces TaxID=2593676 RepID=UPI00367EC9AC